jgi:hypothetical protein
MPLTREALRARIEDAIDIVQRADADWMADPRNDDLYAVLNGARSYFRSLLMLAVARGEMSREAMESCWTANR